MRVFKINGLILSSTIVIYQYNEKPTTKTNIKTDISNMDMVVLMWHTLHTECQNNIDIYNVFSIPKGVPCVGMRIPIYIHKLAFM